MAGEYGGRRIVAPPGTATRPTTERVREALFSILGSVAGLHVLDCFAGAGTLGLEALSRSAELATFVERDRVAAAVISRNIETLGVGGRSRVLTLDWRRALEAEARAGRRYDLILADPPHADVPGLSDALGDAVATVTARPARFVLEYGASTPPPTMGRLDVQDRQDRKYGDIAIAIVTIGDGG